MELPKKLKIDLQLPVWTVNLPNEVAGLLPGADIKTRLGKKRPVEQLIFFATDSAQLAETLPRLAAYTGHGTLFWICYPKKSGRIQSDLIAMEPWQVVFDAGYRAQTSVAINDDWTGMRFTNAPRKKASRAEIPMEERKTEGIDYTKRTVVLPEDALFAVNRHTGLADFFYGMSFSHKREYVEAIADAKKPETRARRIEKMVAMALQLKQEKALKKADGKH